MQTELLILQSSRKSNCANLDKEIEEVTKLLLDDETLCWVGDILRILRDTIKNQEEEINYYRKTNILYRADFD